MDALTCATPLSRPVAHDRPFRPAWDCPRLSVVIVNYQRWDDTARLVAQLRQSLALNTGLAEIVVIDNNSPGHPIIKEFRRAPDVSLRRWRSNRGFACAVNEGCRLSRGDWFLLLNPDTSVPSGFLDHVLARLDAFEPRTGIIGFELLDDDGSTQMSTGRFPGLLSTLTRLMLSRRKRKYSPPPTAGPCQVDWVTGCCLLLRRDCFTDLGGLDPRFFLYYEDVDLCHRARQQGWTVLFDPTTAIVHHRPLHSRPVPPYLRLVTRHALLTYALKHWPGWQLPVLGGVIRLEALARGLWEKFKGTIEADWIFAELDRLVCDMMAGRLADARERLIQVVRFEEQHRVVEPVDHHPSQPASRPAQFVSVQCAPLPTSGHAGAGR